MLALLAGTCFATSVGTDLAEKTLLYKNNIRRVRKTASGVEHSVLQDSSVKYVTTR